MTNRMRIRDRHGNDLIVTARKGVRGWQVIDARDKAGERISLGHREQTIALKRAEADEVYQRE